jgi:hypothetical protein
MSSSGTVSNPPRSVLVSTWAMNSSRISAISAGVNSWRIMITPSLA